MKRILSSLIFVFLSMPVFGEGVVNVYVWGGEIPRSLIQKFERKTGIQVNFSTYDSNETLYSKLQLSKVGLYDVILPSGYFVERMAKKGLLQPIAHQRLSNYSNIAPTFLNPDYDPANRYSIPYIWGATGIFYHAKNIQKPPQAWRDLWNRRFRDQLLLMDDMREVMSMAALSLGFQPNHNSKGEIAQMLAHLLQLVPNIKLLINEGIPPLMIDEDMEVGMAWNGDTAKAIKENPNIRFVYPKEGFVIWVDAFAIPHNAPHPNEAYRFINFMLEASSGRKAALNEGHALCNQRAIASLPRHIRENAVLYPDKTTLARGHIQRDLDENSLNAYFKAWQAFKLSL